MVSFCRCDFLILYMFTVSSGHSCWIWAFVASLYWYPWYLVSLHWFYNLILGVFWKYVFNNQRGVHFVWKSMSMNDDKMWLYCFSPCEESVLFYFWLILFLYKSCQNGYSLCFILRLQKNFGASYEKCCLSLGSNHYRTLRFPVQHFIWKSVR